jgi:hypothetical protein
MKLHPRICRIHLEIEGRCLHGFLFVASELGEAVGECVGDAEFHQVSLKQSAALPQ